jgi:hypothetical protein
MLELLDIGLYRSRGATPPHGVVVSNENRPVASKRIAEMTGLKMPGAVVEHVGMSVNAGFEAAPESTAPSSLS